MDPEQNNDLIAELERRRNTGVLAVACPTCGEAAALHRPFAWLTGEAAERAKADPTIPGRPERGGYVVELYPEVFLWTDAERAEAGGQKDGLAFRRGVLSCTACGHHAKHRMVWPNDLYYRIRIDGHEMLAYTREHAHDNLVRLQQLRIVPGILREILAEELAGAIPPAVLESPRLERAIEALIRVLGGPPDSA